MKKKAAKKPPVVECPNCYTMQPDTGRRNTCRRCGYQPVPSYAYPRSHAFHPDYVSKKKGKQRR